jgi:hypothetical protein
VIVSLTFFSLTSSYYIWKYNVTHVLSGYRSIKFLILLTVYRYSSAW